MFPTSSKFSLVVSNWHENLVNCIQSNHFFNGSSNEKPQLELAKEQRAKYPINFTTVLQPPHSIDGSGNHDSRPLSVAFSEIYGCIPEWSQCR